MLKLNLSLIIVLLLLTCCSSSNHKEKPAFSFSYKTVQRLHPNCKDDDKKNGCVKLKYTFPELTLTNHQPFADSLRQHIISFLFDSTSNSLSEGAFDTLASDWFTMYNTTLDKFPSYKLEWEENKEVRILQHDSTYISLEFSEHEFSGGAHGIQEKYYASYKIPSGKKLAVRGILKKNMYPKLLSMADSLFRKQKKLSSRDNLKENGFWFERGTFSLTDNFALTKKGLIFYYNPYEIAPYAEGPTRLLISYQQVNGILQKPYRNTAKKLVSKKP